MGDPKFKYFRYDISYVIVTGVVPHTLQVAYLLICDLLVMYKQSFIH